MADPKETDPLRDPDRPAEPPPAEPAPDDRREPERPDQVGIVPGRIPGHPVDPHDPRFPGSQPDLA